MVNGKQENQVVMNYLNKLIAFKDKQLIKLLLESEDVENLQLWKFIRIICKKK